MTFLGNDYRITKISFLLIIIITLCIYSYHDNFPGSLYRDCIINPDSCTGISLALGDRTKIGAVREKNYDVLTCYGIINAKGTVDPSHTNRYVNVILKINNEGEFETQEIYIRPHKLLKVLVSIVPVLLIFILFIRKYRFCVEKMLFEERKGNA